MKKSELKNLIREVISEEKMRLKEMEDTTKSGILGFIIGVAAATLGKGVTPTVDDPTVKQAKDEYEMATKKFAEILNDYSGETGTEKMKDFTNQVGGMYLSKPLKVDKKFRKR